MLMRAMHRAGFDPASADEAILHLLEQAHEAVCAERQIESEAAWMSAVLANTWFQSYRRRARDRTARHRLAAPTGEMNETWRDAELHEELDVVAERLPKRFALAIRLYLRGLDAREVRTAICAELAVAPEQARRIERSSFARMRSALGATEHGA